MKKTDENVTTEYQEIFEEYFNRCYTENRDLQNVSYREMLDDKEKSIGFTAELQYKNFKQNVNIFWNNSAPLLVNSVFTFKAELTDYCCHFVDVLDYYDSDDISFYTYTHCTDKTRTINALNKIMSATKKYWLQLNEVALTPSISQSIFDEVYSDELTLEDLEEYPLNKVEEATDFAFATYEILYKRDELKRTLARAAKKNKLDTKFEKRAWRVLSKESFREVKSKEKQRGNAHNYSKSDRITLWIILGIFAVIFAVIFAFIGNKLDDMLLGDWIGRDKGDTVLAFLTIGAFTGLVIAGLLPPKVFKLFMSEKRYKGLEAYEMAEKSPKWMAIAGVIGYLALCMFFVTFFCFNGIGFNNNGEILNKDTAFSQVEAYKIDETEIAIVKGSYNKGYSEYIDTAYAFKLDNEWVDFGVPNDEAKPIIEKAIKNREIKTYDSVEDIRDKE